MKRSARCLCDAVEIEVDTEASMLINCHCRSCRRAHGAAFVTTTPVPDADFDIVRGEGVVTRHVGRSFCSRCGSRLFNRSEEHPGVTMLIVACLDEEPTAQPLLHINVESKAPWHEILDDRPQHAGFAPGMEPSVAKD